MREGVRDRDKKEKEIEWDMEKWRERYVYLKRGRESERKEIKEY